MKKRTATVKRKTKETDITVKLDIDGSGKTKINTGLGFLDHMLELFAFHGLFDIEISAKGDLKVDIHHTNEDVGIVLGDAFKEALGDKKGITRAGNFSWPMEEVLATVALDISGRGKFSLRRPEPVFEGEPDPQEGYALKDAEHFFEAFAKHFGMDLSITIQPMVKDIHTTLEPAFKALGKALSLAIQIDPRRKGIPSTKGVID
ncbi:MAG: imidazoleglycerol-phosphate dehydratase [Candidatus Omnitrophica bacterium]|nr:imidazoleglycerol-phosphate dehydratase [Candidatus Omnitrophota bacterium]